MDTNASPTVPETTARRRSGRVVKAPTKFTPEPTTQSSAAKRKRTDNDEEDVENESPESDEEMSDALDDDSDDDHPAPKSRKKKPAASQTSRAKKPSSKKPKINGAQPARAAQHVGLPSRPKKTVRIDAGDKGTGLFGRDSCPLDVAVLILTQL